MTLVEGEGTAALAGIPRTGPAPTDPVRLVMARRLLGVASETSLRDVARELYESEVGVVLVDNPGGATGLLSERDLVEVVADGDDLDERQAADIMTADLVTAEPDDSIATVGALMRDAGVRHVPIAIAGTVVGVVSIRDILAVLLAGLEGGRG
jgi:CBS domain-containing protein